MARQKKQTQFCFQEIATRSQDLETLACLDLYFLSFLSSHSSRSADRFYLTTYWYASEVSPSDGTDRCICTCQLLVLAVAVAASLQFGLSLSTASMRRPVLLVILIRREVRPFTKVQLTLRTVSLTRVHFLHARLSAHALDRGLFPLRVLFTDVNAILASFHNFTATRNRVLLY